MCPKEHFELENVLSFFFVGWLKIPVFWRKLFKKLVKNASCVCWRTFGGCVLKRGFLIISWIERNILEFKRVFFDGVVKTSFLISSRKFWLRSYILKKYFFVTFLHWTKVILVLDGSFESELTTLQSNWPGDYFEEKNFCSKENFYQWWTVRRKVSGLFQSFGVLSELHSMCPEDHLELRNFLRIIWWGWAKRFQPLGKNFCEVCQKCIVRVKKIFGGKLFCFQKKLILGHRAKSFWLFGKIFRPDLSKLVFTGSDVNFGWFSQ